MQNWATPKVKTLVSLTRGNSSAYSPLHPTGRWTAASATVPQPTTLPTLISQRAPTLSAKALKLLALWTQSRVSTSLFHVVYTFTGCSTRDVPKSLWQQDKTFNYQNLADQSLGHLWRMDTSDAQLPLQMHGLQSLMNHAKGEYFTPP